MANICGDILKHAKGKNMKTELSDLTWIITVLTSCFHIVTLLNVWFKHFLNTIGAHSCVVPVGNIYL